MTDEATTDDGVGLFGALRQARVALAKGVEALDKAEDRCVHDSAEKWALREEAERQRDRLREALDNLTEALMHVDVEGQAGDMETYNEALWDAEQLLAPAALQNQPEARSTQAAAFDPTYNASVAPSAPTQPPTGEGRKGPS